MADELAMLDATAQAELVRRKEVTPLELVDAAIARIEGLNPNLKAGVTRFLGAARAAAASATVPAGPFRGVPFLLKDLDINAAGQPLHCGMKFLRRLNWIEPRDLYLAGKFHHAGLIVFGKA